MGLFDKAKSSFSSKVSEKANKYDSLPDKALLSKDVQKQRKVNRGQVSTGTASAACIGTAGISAPVHGGLAVYEGGKLAKQAFKSQMTRNIIERRNTERMEKGGPVLQRRQPTFMQSLSDRTQGFADGALGTGAGADVLKQILREGGR